MTHDIFISYSSKDQKVVEGLSAYLEQQGIRCFVAYRDIPKGAVWAAKITEAIEICQCMVIVFSENFNSSPQVDREIEMCFEEEKPVIPFKIQDSPLSGAKKYYLKNINWLDAFPEPEKCFGELCLSVKRLMSDNKERSSHDVRFSKKSYGMPFFIAEGDKRVVSNFIIKNTPLPCSYYYDFFTARDNQETIRLELYESDSLEKEISIEEALLLDKIDIKLPVSVKRITHLKVLLELNVDETLMVKLESVGDKKVSQPVYRLKLI